MSSEGIVDAALALMDEQGIGAASMRAVAERLGVRAMSLYKHFRDRDALLDAVVERIVNELADDPDVPLQPSGQGWRPYLAALARGVRRYARAHPHAFPLVATRPPSAPWVNPPLRSLRWIEAMLASLARDGFSDDQMLFAYRVFNTFLLGYLLLETSAMILNDPQPGDGAFTTGSVEQDELANSTDPVPGGLSPTRTPEDREAIEDADTAEELIDPVGAVDPADYPTLHRLAEGLAEDRWNDEFDAALETMLDRIEVFLS